MARGMPSMTALLALLAVAGYQHRDKLAELLGNATRGPQGGPQGGGRPEEAGQRGGQMGSQMGGGIGALLSGGIGELVERFRNVGQGETAESWVAHGPNRPVAPDQLASAIGPETLEALTRQTGLSREEILARLSRDLPHAVDSYTPEGRIPTT